MTYICNSKIIIYSIYIDISSIWLSISYAFNGIRITINNDVIVTIQNLYLYYVYICSISTNQSNFVPPKKIHPVLLPQVRIILPRLSDERNPHLGSKIPTRIDELQSYGQRQGRIQSHRLLGGKSRLDKIQPASRIFSVWLITPYQGCVYMILFEKVGFIIGPSSSEQNSLKNW